MSKVQDLRGAGVSYRDIARCFAPPDVCRAAPPSLDRDVNIISAAIPSPARQYPDARPFLRTLDAVDQALGFFDAAGKLIYGNRVLRDRLAGPGARDWLLSELRLFVEYSWSLVRLRTSRSAEHVIEDLTIQEVPSPPESTGITPVRFKGSYIGLDLFGSGSTILVSLERAVPQPLEDSTLRERFGLTRSECRVLRLVVEGQSNSQIARTLFISPHTVRTHVGVILSKLGVRSRAAATARVLSAPTPGEACEPVKGVRRRGGEVE